MTDSLRRMEVGLKVHPLDRHVCGQNQFLPWRDSNQGRVVAIPSASPASRRGVRRCIQLMKSDSLLKEDSPRMIYPIGQPSHSLLLILSQPLNTGRGIVLYSTIRKPIRKYARPEETGKEISPFSRTGFGTIRTDGLGIPRPATINSLIGLGIARLPPEWGEKSLNPVSYFLDNRRDIHYDASRTFREVLARLISSPRW